MEFLRSFLDTRPSKAHLKKKGILRERVFGCDLGELLHRTDEDSKYSFGLLNGATKNGRLISLLEQKKNIIINKKKTELKILQYVKETAKEAFALRVSSLSVFMRCAFDSIQESNRSQKISHLRLSMTNNCCGQ